MRRLFATGQHRFRRVNPREIRVLYKSMAESSCAIDLKGHGFSRAEKCLLNRL